MKRIFIDRTYDPDDCTSTGWDIEVAKTRLGYSVVATTHSRWQGSRCGEEYWYDGFEDVEAAETFARELEDSGELYLIDLGEISWRGVSCGWRLGKNRGVLIQ